MKLYAQQVLTVDQYGCVETVLEKKADFCKEAYSTYTSGLIKYLGLEEGTKVRVTVEVIEDLIK